MSNRGTLVRNLDKVKQLYLYEYQDTVAISRMFNVSSSAVSELLTRRGITREHREDLLIEHVRAICEQFQIANVAMAHTHVVNTFAITQKQLVRILKNRKVKLKYYMDPGSAEHDRAVEQVIKMLNHGETIACISRALNIKYHKVSNIAQEHNIEPPLVKRFMQRVSKEQLSHELSSMNCEQVGKRHGKYSKDVVIMSAKEYGIAIGISSETSIKLKSKEWCSDAYTQFSSYKQISELLGDVGPDTVAFYFQIKHKIPKYSKINEYPVLLDKDAVEQIYQGKSIVAAASAVGCSPWLFKEHLLNHDIEITRHNHMSLGENEVANFIKSLGVTMTQGDRNLISPKEVDILCTDHGVAFEYCGIYYHSSKFKNVNYHKNKLASVNAKGYRLITMYETEWINHQSLIKRKIADILGKSTCANVYARKTKVEYLSESDTRIFLIDNHIQGFTKCSVRIGLKLDNKIVALMAFRKEKNGRYNLVRYATSDRVTGGFTKLLSFFKNNYDFEEIITFADLRWSDPDNNIYEKFGFERASKLSPAFMWVRRSGLLRREHFMKCKQKELLDVFDQSLTEEQNCFNNGIYKIHDCGKHKYILSTIEKQNVQA